MSPGDEHLSSLFWHTTVAAAPLFIFCVIIASEIFVLFFKGFRCLVIIRVSKLKFVFLTRIKQLNNNPNLLGMLKLGTILFPVIDEYIYSQRESNTKRCQCSIRVELLLESSEIIYSCSLSLGKLMADSISTPRNARICLFVCATLMG